MIFVTGRKPIVVGNPGRRGSMPRRLAFAADVPGPRALGRGLLVEADALAFFQLVEGALHRAAVKEPLLAAVVPDEPETPVTNESLDRTLGIRVSLGSRARAENNQVSFHPIFFVICDGRNST